jgi:hypothetical protein
VVGKRSCQDSDHETFPKVLVLIGKTEYEADSKVIQIINPQMMAITLLEKKIENKNEASNVMVANDKKVIKNKNGEVGDIIGLINRDDVEKLVINNA